jgi:hypothetical protein
MHMSDKPLTRGSYLDELLLRQLDRRRFLIGAGGVSLASVLAACAASTSAGTSTKYDTMNVAVADLGVQTPDPMFSYSHSATYAPIGLNVGEQLVRRGYDGKLTPALAASWTISDDHLTWTFTLRDGVKMHDGSKFTANDVLTSIKRVQDKGNAGDFVLNENLVSAITNVKIIDDLHISITTQDPYFRMLDDLPIPVATAYYQSVGEAEFRKKPVAAGPYKFASQALNQSMTFSRFDDFWDSTRIPNFKTLNLLILSEESSRIAGLQAGSVDATNGLSPVAVSQLNGASGVRILTSPDSELVHMIFAALNPLNPTPAKTASKVHDVRVRQAMLYALDRDGMAKSILGGEATPVSTYGLPDTLGHDSANAPYKFDPNKAKQLLQDAGATGFEFTLVSKSSDQGLPQVQDGQQLAGRRDQGQVPADGGGPAGRPSGLAQVRRRVPVLAAGHQAIRPDLPGQPVLQPPQRQHHERRPEARPVRGAAELVVRPERARGAGQGIRRLPVHDHARPRPVLAQHQVRNWAAREGLEVAGWQRWMRSFLGLALELGRWGSLARATTPGSAPRS